jgi:hypothetical protein
MKITKLRNWIISLAICVTSGMQVNADQHFTFNGTWSGKGQMLDNDVKSDCQTIKFTIIQNEKELTFEEEEFICGEQNIVRKNVTFEIRGNELWSDGRKRGSISASEFFIDVLDQTPNSFVQIAGYGLVENSRFRYSEIIHYRFDKEAGKFAIAAEMRL